MNFNYRLVTKLSRKFDLPQIAHKNSIPYKNSSVQIMMLRVLIKIPFAY